MKLYEVFDNPAATTPVSKTQFSRFEYYFSIHKETGKTLATHDVGDHFLGKDKKYKSLNDRVKQLEKSYRKSQGKVHDYVKSVGGTLGGRQQDEWSDEERALRMVMQSSWDNYMDAKRKSNEYQTNFAVSDDWITYTILADAVNNNSKLPSAKDQERWSTDLKDSFYQFDIPREGLYEFHFSSSEQNSNWKDNILGTGHSIKVMSTVRSVLKKVLANPKIKHIIIPAFAHEPSRVKLYDRMIGKLSKKRWKHNGVVYWLI